MERSIGALDKLDWLGLTASLLAVAACYGTLAVVAILSAMGVRLTLHEGTWAGAIVFFAILALVAIALGRQRHGRSAPTTLTLAGAVMILWVMLAQYALLMELIGFALLVCAAIWDWRLRKPIRQEEKRNG